MLKILGNLPSEDIGLALSGGVDSMTIANFLLKGRKDFTAFYFNHGTPHGDEAEQFVIDWCEKHSVPLITSWLNENPPSIGSRQEFYRNKRYEFFDANKNFNIILAHHLDDVLETWLFSSFHGIPKLIPPFRGHMMRPFLLTSKEDILDYAHTHGVEWIEDGSNAETDYMRNYIRHEIVPKVEYVNPGIRKVLFKKLKDNYG